LASGVHGANTRAGKPWRLPLQQAPEPRFVQVHGTGRLTPNPRRPAWEEQRATLRLVLGWSIAQAMHHAPAKPDRRSLADGVWCASPRGARRGRGHRAQPRDGSGHAGELVRRWRCGAALDRPAGDYSVLRPIEAGGRLCGNCEHGLGFAQEVRRLRPERVSARRGERNGPPAGGAISAASRSCARWRPALPPAARP